MDAYTIHKAITQSVSFLSDPVCYRLNYKACLTQKYGNCTVFILHQTAITTDPHEEGCRKSSWVKQFQQTKSKSPQR